MSPDTPTHHRSTRLSRYLDDLNLRPNEPLVDLDEPGFRNSVSAVTLQASASMSLGLSSAPSRSSLSNIAGASVITSMASSQPMQTGRNPEADSFSYIETLLESLAVLGKLGHALDIVAQKLPQEIYSLVETTLEEVSERAEYGRRASMIGGATATLGREDIVILTSTGLSGALGGANMFSSSMVTGHGSLLPASSLRLAALEMSTKRMDQEIMKDFFWTLYSKLDAVAQGLRVVYEVSNRIGSVSRFDFTFRKR